MSNLQPRSRESRQGVVHEKVFGPGEHKKREAANVDHAAVVGVDALQGGASLRTDPTLEETFVVKPVAPRKALEVGLLRRVRRIEVPHPEARHHRHAGLAAWPWEGAPNALPRQPTPVLPELGEVGGQIVRRSTNALGGAETESAELRPEGKAKPAEPLFASIRRPPVEDEAVGQIRMVHSDKAPDNRLARWPGVEPPEGNDPRSARPHKTISKCHLRLFRNEMARSRKTSRTWVEEQTLLVAKDLAVNPLKKILGRDRRRLQGNLRE